MVEITKNEKNGAKFTNFRNENEVDGVCCIGEDRFVIHGKPKITILENSYKFGKQIQFSIICPKEIVRKEKRNENSKWNTIEINIPFADGIKLINEVNKVNEVK